MNHKSYINVRFDLGSEKPLSEFLSVPVFVGTEALLQAMLLFIATSSYFFLRLMCDLYL